MEGGVPKSSAFERRTGEEYLSVYLLDFFQKPTELENVIEVKKYMTEGGFKCKKKGSFAVINIEQCKKYIFEKMEEKEEISDEISFREKNLPHCGIFHDAEDLLIAKLLAKCVINNYPVKNLDDSNIAPPSPS